MSDQDTKGDKAHQNKHGEEALNKSGRKKHTKGKGRQQQQRRNNHQKTDKNNDDDDGKKHISQRKTPKKKHDARKDHGKKGGKDALDSRSNKKDTRKKMNFKDQHYEDWYTKEQIDNGINEGNIFVGVLRINGKRRLEAYVSSDNVKQDIFIDGEKHRNRSLNGDIVAVQLFPSEQWKVREKKDSDESVNKVAEALENIKLVDDEGLWQPLVEKNCKAAKQDNPTSKTTSSSKLDGGNAQPCGKVVAILAASQDNAITLARERVSNHIGVLVPAYGFERERPSKLERGKPLPASDPFIEFRPLDNRVPFMHIPREEAPFEFTADPFKYEPPHSKLYEVSLVNWNSRFRFPKGRIIRQVGEAGEIGPETHALLIETGCDHGEFPQNALDVLKETIPENGDWKIPEEEIKARLDLRNSKRIFTIDPSTAKDLDDALHCVKIEANTVKGKNGKYLPEHYEIGVHIADVSYFLEEDGDDYYNPLDKEAQRRSTTVYLVNKVIPMLPPILCEELCSLNEGVDRLAYSCIWRMTEDGDMLPNSPPPWFGRTVIRSCARLDYGLAQNMMDGTVTKDSIDTGDTEDPTCWPDRRAPESPHTKEQVILDVCNLGKIAMNRRKKRFDKTSGGALQLTQTKMTFKLDENGNPTKVRPYPIKNSNKTIEEYMLMANYLVAQKLIMNAGTIAFIRHHPPPESKSMGALIKTLEHKGIPFDPNALASAAGLHETMERLERTESPEMMQIVYNLLRKPMKPAEYATAGSLKQKKWRHWALNIPYYTHFTSPIRRYADVIVHRLLTSVLNGTVHEYPKDEDDLQKFAEHCNEKKEASKQAQDMSDKLFFCLYIKDQAKKGTPIITQAVVQELGPHSFTLLLTDYGVDIRVHAEKDWNATEVRAFFENPSSSTSSSKKPKSKKNDDENQNNNVSMLAMHVKDHKKERLNLKLEILSKYNVVLLPTLQQSCRLSFKTNFHSIVESS